MKAVINGKINLKDRIAREKLFSSLMALRVVYLRTKFPKVRK